MNRKGNCYVNAPMECFWGTLKNELAHHPRYETRAQAMRGITTYIEIIYNRQRWHSKLGDLAPAVFAHKCQQQAGAWRRLRPLSTTDLN